MIVSHTTTIMSEGGIYYSNVIYIFVIRCNYLC